MKSLVLFGEGEAPWDRLMRRLGRRDPEPAWRAPRGATPPGGSHVRRLLEATASRALDTPQLTDDVMEQLAAAFPGVYRELDDGGPSV